MGRGWLKTVWEKLRQEPSLPTKVMRVSAPRRPMPRVGSAAAVPAAASGAPLSFQSETLSKGA